MCVFVADVSVLLSDLIFDTHMKYVLLQIIWYDEKRNELVFNDEKIQQVLKQQDNSNDVMSGVHI